jgi:hypothetical protein
MTFLEDNLDQFEEGAINTASGLTVGLMSTALKSWNSSNFNVRLYIIYGWT